MRVTLIHNPSAGTKQPAKEDIIKELEKHGYEVAYVSAKDKALKKFLKSPGDMIVLAGGDGTIGEIAIDLIGKNVPIGLLPLGTANNIALTLGAGGSMQETISKWSDKAYQGFDIGQVSGLKEETYFIESVGCGLFAHLIINTKGKETNSHHTRKGKVQYAMEKLRRVAVEYKPQYYHVQLDGKDRSGNYLCIEAMNTKAIGPNIVLAPDAHPGDQHLNVFFLTEDHRPLFLDYLDNVIDGKEASVNLPAYPAKYIKISADQSEIHVDDETPETSSGEVEISLFEKQLIFL